MEGYSLVSGILIGVACLFALAGSEDVDLGSDLVNKACREDNTTFNWLLPAKNISFSFIDLYYRPRGSARVFGLMSKIGNDDWSLNSHQKRYTGRLFNTSEHSTFLLNNILILDRGFYEYKGVTNDRINYVGNYSLIVWSDDNLFAKLQGSNTSDGSYHYTWKKHHESPAVGVRMVASSKTEDGKTKQTDPNDCLFEDQLECEVVFGRKDFGGISGTVSLTGTTLFADNVRKCPHIPETVSSMIITITPGTTLSSGAIAAIVLTCVLAVVIGCVVPPIVNKYKKKKATTIPLNKGLRFVMYSTDLIEKSDIPSDLAGLYRKPVPMAVTQAYITNYLKEQSSGKPPKRPTKNKYSIEDESTSEAGLGTYNALQVASAIKYFFVNEKTPWLPEDVQYNITSGNNAYERVVNKEGEENSNVDKGENIMADIGDNIFDVDAVKDILQGNRSEQANMRRDILVQILRHFAWYDVTYKALKPDETGKMMDLDGIAKIFSQNLFKETDPKKTNPMELEGQRSLERQKKFLLNLIHHVNELFPVDAVETNLDNTLDTTATPLNV